MLSTQFSANNGKEDVMQSTSGQSAVELIRVWRPKLGAGVMHVLLQVCNSRRSHTFVVVYV